MHICTFFADPNIQAGQVEEVQTDITSPTAKSAKRKRTFRSCTECRATKTRCSGDRPDCVRCRQKALQCNYNDSSEPVWQQQLKMTAALQGSQNSDQEISASGEAQQSKESLSQIESSSLSPPDNERQPPRQDGSWWLGSLHLPESDKVRILVEYVNLTAPDDGIKHQGRSGTFSNLIKGLRRLLTLYPSL